MPPCVPAAVSKQQTKVQCQLLYAQYTEGTEGKLWSPNTYHWYQTGGKTNKHWIIIEMEINHVILVSQFSLPNAQYAKNNLF